ncbi:MAG: esterase [Kurthia sp.]|nr:esterase [Candidatus Kurthia equi]
MKIVCFGDSLTARKEGYPKPMLTMMLSEKVKGHRYVNAGAMGNTTVEARGRLKEDVLNEHPDIVTIMFGSNDCSEKKDVSLTTFHDNLLFCIKKIGSKKVILITPSPVDDEKQLYRKNNELIKYVEIIKELATESHCEVIDFYQHVMEQENYPKLLVGKSDDGLHFGEKLYDQLSDLIAERLKNRERIIEQPLWKKLKNKF